MNNKGLRYLLRLRFNKLVSPTRYSEKLFNLILVGIFVIYGMAVVAFFDYSLDQGDSTVFIKLWVEIIASLIIILNGIIPFYQPQREVIKFFYPVSTIERYLFNVAFDCTSILHLGLVIFSTILLTSSAFGVIDWLFLQFLLIVSQLINRSLKLMVEIVFKREQRYEKEKINVINRNDVKHWRLWITSFWRIKQSRNSLFFAVFFKVIITSCITFVLVTGKKNPDEIRFLWFFLSPLLLFIYIFNNFFGYAHRVTSWIILSGGTILKLVKFYLLCLSIPLFADLLFSYAFWYTTHYSDFWSHSAMYLYLFFFCFTTSIVGAFFFPQKIREFFFTNTRRTSSVLLLFQVVGISYLIDHRLNFIVLLIFSFIIIGLSFLQRRIANKISRHLILKI